MQSVEYKKRETKPDVLCNCTKSRCLKLYCRCFAAGIYCEDRCACEECLNKPDYEDFVQDIRQQIEQRNPLAFAPPVVNPPNDSPNVTAIGDGNLTNSSSARHKKGCKCKRSKCLQKYCDCYRAKVGCSDACHCEDCDNSFGKKSESMFQRAENRKNLSHEMPNTREVMSHRTKVGTSHNIRDYQNVSHVESEKGTNFHGYSSALSPKQPCPNKEASSESLSIDDIYETIGDDMDRIFSRN